MAFAKQVTDAKAVPIVLHGARATSRVFIRPTAESARDTRTTSFNAVEIIGTNAGLTKALGIPARGQQVRLS